MYHDACLELFICHLTFSFQNAVMTSELLDHHQDALKEKESTIAELRHKVEELSAAGKAATEKINRLQEDLNHKVAVQSSWEKKLELLRGWN